MPTSELIALLVAVIVLEIGLLALVLTPDMPPTRCTCSHQTGMRCWCDVDDDDEGFCETTGGDETTWSEVA